MADWKSLALDSAIRQGVRQDLVLSTVEAETGGRNILGDSGNAVGYGQVWPKWHMHSFKNAALKLGLLDVPLNDIGSLIQYTLDNDAFSMEVTAATIKSVWEGSTDWGSFTKAYVGPAIPQSDFNRRKAIWDKYRNTNFDYIGSQVGQGEIGKTFSTVANSLKTGDLLYGRRYRVIVSDKDGNGLDVSDLRCTFSIYKTVQIQSNYSEVAIYNLNVDTESSIIKEGDRIIIEAGYEGNQYGVIFDGNIVQPIRDKESGTTYRLTLVALDGDRFMTFGALNVIVPKGNNPRQTIEQYASQAVNPAQLGNISQSLSQTTLTRGKVVFGMAKDYLRQLAQSENATFYVDDGKVNIIKAEDLPADEIIELSPSSGLIGVPQQTQYGMSAKCLLNPRIKLNSLVHIDNSLIRANRIAIGQVQLPFDNDGIYRVIELTHNGDTRGNDWYTEIVTVNQAGKIPELIQDANGKAW